MPQYTIRWTSFEHQLLEIEIVFFFPKKSYTLYRCHECVIAKNVNSYFSFSFYLKGLFKKGTRPYQFIVNLQIHQASLLFYTRLTQWNY